MAKKKGAASDSTRTLGKEGAGSGGDTRDRFRGSYKPGANKQYDVETPLDKVVGGAKKVIEKFQKPKKKEGK